MKYFFLFLFLVSVAKADCISNFQVNNSLADGFVNGPISVSCAFAGTELDIVRVSGNTTDITLIDVGDTSPLAGETITTANLLLNVTTSYKFDSNMPNIIGDNFNWFQNNLPGNCLKNYNQIIGTNAIGGFPLSQVPPSGLLTIPVNPQSINMSGHTKYRLTFAVVPGTSWSEVDFTSYDGDPTKAPQLQVTHTGPKCAVSPGITIHCDNTVPGSNCLVMP